MVRPITVSSFCRGNSVPVPVNDGYGVFFLLQDQLGYFRPDIQPVHPIGPVFECCQQGVSFLRPDLPVGTCQEEGNSGLFQFMQCRQHAHQNLPYFAERGLLVIERIEQSENQGGMDMLSPANFR
jgi:hypothetical protein